MQADAIYKLIDDVLNSVRRTLQIRPAAPARAVHHGAGGPQEAVGVGSMGATTVVACGRKRSVTGWSRLLAGQGGPGVGPRRLCRAQPVYTNQGEHAVAGQDLMQAESDIFLGLDPRPQPRRRDRARLLRPPAGRTGNSPCRSSEMPAAGPDAVRPAVPVGPGPGARPLRGPLSALAAYLGRWGELDQAIADFAETCADQNERDYAALKTAVKEGRAETTTEI